MKKLICLLITATIAVMLFTACGGDKGGAPATDAPSATDGANNSAAPVETPEATETPTETPEATEAPAPTETPASTAAPTPTQTPAPTETPTPTPSAPTQSLEELMAALYEAIPEEQRPMVSNAEINAENSGYYVGIDQMELQEGLASEPMMTSVAHSVCLVRVKDGTDIASVMEQMKNGVDGYKWICVGVDKENIIADHVGNTIILILDNYDAELIHQAFLDNAV